MKILYVITGADIGGAQRHVFYLSEWFSRIGWEVHVVLGEDGPLKKELTDRNIGVTIIPIARNIVIKKDFKALRTLYLFIKKEKFDIVHSHSSKAGILARLAGFFNRVEKNIFTAHGFVFTDPTLTKKKTHFYVLLEKMCSWISTDIITVSRFDYQQGKTNGINERKMSQIHNGIPETSIISPSQWKKKQHTLRERDKRIVGFVGRFASEKNITMLLRVAALFKNHNVEFWIIGDGPLYNHYQAVIKKRHLPIQLKGSQDNVLEWMDQMHLMVITSHKEGLPFVLLEACGRGLPVISTDVGGVKEVIGNEKLVVAINDDESMYQRLSALLSDDDARETLGRYFLERSNSFTVEQMCQETKKVYSRGKNKHVNYQHYQSY
jgi:glycosyltransferase involved in cell wall biosynthesis